MDNQQFLKAVFGDDAPYVHVTDFPDDPNHIPTGAHLMAWRGDWFSRYHLRDGTNQYFTISIFNPDERGIARRRKALYLRTPCIVLDDVREKLDITNVKQLPEPSWVLETSPGSEQWGYILDTPCSDRARVENLLDGLVANGLAPDGRDPGMKGVTRYVRLPGGYNTKRSKMVDGKPFKCRLITWQPFCRTTLEELAAPFNVDLDAPRREARVDGAADMPDHPLLQIPDLIHVKDMRSKGRFDVTCPWVDEHTDEIDNGAAIFTNQDYSLGFKCHHGSCEGRTGADLVRWIEEQSPGFNETLNTWKAAQTFASIEVTPSVESKLTFIDTPAQESANKDVIEEQLDKLNRMVPGSPERRELAEKILKVCEDLTTLAQKHYHDEVARLEQWSNTEFTKIIKALRTEWYKNTKSLSGFYDDFVFVHDINRFYNNKTNIFYTADSFRNSFMDKDPEVVKTALQDGVVTKVQRLDFAPKKPAIYQEEGITYGNLWGEETMKHGTRGDVSPWLDHMKAMGFDDGMIAHISKWMAFTIKHPDVKINHILLLGGAEGIGKDMLLYPIVKYLGRYVATIDGWMLLSQFNSWLVSKKLLIINEAELFDHRASMEVGARLKPLAAAPPHRLTVNQKNIAEIEISNIVNVVMTTNKRVPIRLEGMSRRFYGVWSDLDIRNHDGQITDEWLRYFKGIWSWLESGGAEYVIHYLLNEVDLSEFDPKQAPPVTEFLKDITEASKSAPLQAIEYAISHKVGLFESDLLTSSDIAEFMQAGLFFSQVMLHGAKPSVFTPTLVSRLLNELKVPVMKRANLPTTRVLKVWILRDVERYAGMSKADLYNEYKRQITVARTRRPLEVVAGTEAKAE